MIYLEYNSTINCSLIVSGISSLAGTFRNLPVSNLLSHSIQECCVYLFVLNDSVITINDFDFSLTLTISPSFNVYEGILQSFPFIWICL